MNMTDDLNRTLVQRPSGEPSPLCHMSQGGGPANGGIGGDNPIAPQIEDRLENRVDLRKAQIRRDLDEEW